MPKTIAAVKKVLHRVPLRASFLGMTFFHSRFTHDYVDKDPDGDGFHLVSSGRNLESGRSIYRVTFSDGTSEYFYGPKKGGNLAGGIKIFKRLTPVNGGDSLVLLRVKNENFASRKLLMAREARGLVALGYCSYQFERKSKSGALVCYLVSDSFHDGVVLNKIWGNSLVRRSTDYPGHQKIPQLSDIDYGNRVLMIQDLAAEYVELVAAGLAYSDLNPKNVMMVWDKELRRYKAHLIDFDACKMQIG